MSEWYNKSDIVVRGIYKYTKPSNNFNVLEVNPCPLDTRVGDVIDREFVCHQCCSRASQKHLRTRLCKVELGFRPNRHALKSATAYARIPGTDIVVKATRDFGKGDRNKASLRERVTNLLVSTIVCVQGLVSNMTTYNIYEKLGDDRPHGVDFYNVDDLDETEKWLVRELNRHP